MRTPMIRVVGSLVIAGSVLMTAGCLGNSSDGANASSGASSAASSPAGTGFGGGTNGGDLGALGNSAACKTMLSELQNLSTNAMSKASDPAAMADAYTESASKIRTAAAQADADAKAAGEDLANAIDQLGSMLKSAANGGNVQMPDTSTMSSAGGRLGQACAS